jgi:hypothetical protein
MSTYLLSEWAIAREKTRGTLAWLRTFPVRESIIVGAKFGVFACLVCCMFLLTLLVCSPSILRDTSVPQIILNIAIIIAFGGVCLFCRLCFRGKLGPLLPFVALMPLVLGWIGLTDHDPGLKIRLARMLSEGWAQGLLASALLVFYVGLAWASGAYLKSADVQFLED